MEDKIIKGSLCKYNWGTEKYEPYTTKELTEQITNLKRQLQSTESDLEQTRRSGMFPSDFSLGYK